MKNDPQSEAELIERARGLAGLSFATLASKFYLRMPKSLTQAKGLIGQLIENSLGATAGNKSEPDFQRLGIELKTIPVDAQGKPQESTYVCSVTLLPHETLSWENSRVRKKLARVLWIPVEGEKHIPPDERRIGMPVLWSPNQEQENILRQDWEEFMEIITLGQVDTITARYGTVLQIRPKAANAKARRKAVNVSGESYATIPRGFYLRASFTANILASHYLV